VFYQPLGGMPLVLLLGLIKVKLFLSLAIKPLRKNLFGLEHTIGTKNLNGPEGLLNGVRKNTRKS